MEKRQFFFDIGYNSRVMRWRTVMVDQDSNLQSCIYYPRQVSRADVLAHLRTHFPAKAQAPDMIYFDHSPIFGDLSEIKETIRNISLRTAVVRMQPQRDGSPAERALRKLETTFESVFKPAIHPNYLNVMIQLWINNGTETYDTGSSRIPLLEGGEVK